MAPFTAAEGWGTFSQKTTGGALEAKLVVKHGKLPLKTFSLTLPASGAGGEKVTVTLDGKPVAASVSKNGTRATIALDATIHAGQTLLVSL